MAESEKKHLKGSRFEAAELSPGFLFWKTFNSWQRKIRESLEPTELTQVQYSILAAIDYLSSASEAVSQQDVVRQLSMDKMMVSDVVRALQKRKLISRRSHPIDRRSFALSLTSEAKSKLQQAVPLVEFADEAFFGKLSASNLEKLKDLLKQLNQTTR